jgi:hypothetical protein
VGLDGATWPSDPGIVGARHGRRMRRAFTVVLLVFLLLGAINVYGVRTADVTATGDGFELEIHYTKVSRPGLATPWAATVRREGGFEGPVSLATTSSFFDLYDENGLDPDPLEATADADRIIWEFATPPEGDELSVTFDARIEPAAQLTWIDATTELIADDQVVAAVDYRIFVMP